LAERTEADLRKREKRDSAAEKYPRRFHGRADAAGLQSAVATDFHFENTGRANETIFERSF
jgi:hypothetical protein